MEWALELGVLDLPVSTVTPVPLPQARALMLFHSWNKNDVLSGYREWERVVIEVKKKKLLRETWRQEGTVCGFGPEGQVRGLGVSSLEIG